MREAAANLEFEEAARLRDEIKKMKLLDLEFANEALTGAGEEVDKSAPKRWRREAAAEKAEAFRSASLRPPHSRSPQALEPTIGARSPYRNLPY